jgi:hypothetical protein
MAMMVCGKIGDFQQFTILSWKENSQLATFPTHGLWNDGDDEVNLQWYH